MMKREVGNRDFEIWLLGDSNPKNWQDALEFPLDLRHPIRHNIWTSVLDVIQDKVFRQCRRRVDTSFLYIRNAIESPNDKPPPGSIEWGMKIEEEIEEFRKLLHQHNPKLLLCFGAFSFEFARRALAQVPTRNYRYWGAEELGIEFEQRINQFNLNTTNALPLLHRSISGGKFIQSHDYFCGKGNNYFEHVGSRIAEQLIRYRSQLQIWVA
jgi:hypothetical protein